MKRIFAVLLVFLILCGCSAQSQQSSNSITFYYLKQAYTFGQSGESIVAEQRDSSGMRRDLSYLMSMYLLGPVEEDHISPLPQGTRIQCTTKENERVQLELSEAARSLSDIEFSIACSCLSMTCFDITNTTEVTVINGERSITMTPDRLILTDDSSSNPITEETQ